LKDRPFSSGAAKIMKQVKPVRQIEMAELMVATSTLSTSFARVLLVATPARQQKKPGGSLSDKQYRAMEAEVASIQRYH